MQHDVLIAGDGLSGLTMALALNKAGQACALVGPHIHSHNKSTPVTDARTTAIMQDGIAYLEYLGVWDSVQKEAAPLRHMRLVSGDKEIVFSSDMIGLPQFGFNIPNAVLKHHLLNHIQHAKHVTCITGLISDVVFPQAQDRPQIVTVKTEDGTDYQARLVIAADGAKSLVREKANIEATHHNPDQSALVGWINAEHSHDFTSTEFYYRGGPLTVVPTSDPYKMTLVYCDTAENLTALSELSTEEFDAHLTEMTQERFGALQFTGQTQSWPIQSLRAQSLVAPHVALIGETAHLMPPLAAQGFNTSLRDIQILADILRQARSVGSDIASLQTLRTYDTERHMDIQARSRAVNGLNDLIRRDDVMGRRVHGIGFALLDKITPLKKMVMKAALAPRATIRTPLFTDYKNKSRRTSA
jgi:2-octaprenyl-6-methoxyphenol hydroxylase